MSEELLILHGSPTLAGLKTANLFSVPCPNLSELMDEVRRLNRLLIPKGLCMVPIRKNEKRALIYVYRPSRLAQDLMEGHTASMLQNLGYPCKSPGQCIARLAKRLKESPVFPHEIGLFLGYPPEDVQGFIENKAKSFKSAGCWKVYGDVKQAQIKFQMYKKCTDIYYKKWLKGVSIQRLAVAA